MSRPSDLPIFRPKIGGGRGPRTDGGGASLRNAVLAATRRRGREPRTPKERSYRRRVIVKAHIVKMTARGQKAAALHLKYLERDGVERDGSPGRLYGPDGPVSCEAFLEPREGEPHQIRLIISPEDGAELEDLTLFVQVYMNRVERELGRRLEWAAVNHYNTGHPHAHVVIRGLDLDGQEVRMPREFISNRMRRIGEELATEELGPRNEIDVKRQLSREVFQERFTSLDREIERRLTDGQIEVRPEGSQRRPRVDENLIINRLQQLAEFGFAEEVSPTRWALAPKWKEDLRALGERGDIIKQMHLAMGGDTSRYRILKPRERTDLPDGPPEGIVYGRVTAKGLADELRGRFYAVVEASDGGGYYVPIDRRAAEEVRVGDLVSIDPRGRVGPAAENRRGDPEIAATERAPGTKREKEASDRSGGSASVSPTERDPKNERDSKSERNVATDKIGNLSPAPPSDRSEPGLSSAAPARPQYAMQYPAVQRDVLRLTDQIHHRGPVWLDRVPRAALAPYGFGAEVFRALGERDRMLRSVGIDPADPQRLKKLREVERRAVGEQIAEKAREQFLASAPRRFRGQVKILAREAGRGAYAVITDGSRFVVVPMTRDVKASDGKLVAVTRDPGGRLHVRRLDKERGIT